jgi:hypothetical protein
MVKRPAFLVTLVAVMAVGSVTVHAWRGETALFARLRGLNEVPPTNSRASGEFRGSLSRDEATISFRVDYRGLTGAAAAAHIHFGPPRVNGGVMVFLCGGGGKPACPAETSGTVTGTLSAADIVGPAAQGIDPAPAGSFADVVRAIRTGNAYVNVHTARFPGGEIRGQVFVFGFDFNGRGDDDEEH